jgi:hypothetical protein
MNPAPGAARASKAQKCHSYLRLGRGGGLQRAVAIYAMDFRYYFVQAPGGGRPGTAAETFLRPRWGDFVSIHYRSERKVAPMAGLGYFVGPSTTHPELATVLVRTPFQSEGVVYGPGTQRQWVGHPSFLCPADGTYSVPDPAGAALQAPPAPPAWTAAVRRLHHSQQQQQQQRQQQQQQQRQQQQQQQPAARKKSEDQEFRAIMEAAQRQGRAEVAARQ